jgi:hypothetical protein
MNTFMGGQGEADGFGFGSGFAISVQTAPLPPFAPPVPDRSTLSPSSSLLAAATHSFQLHQVT